MEVAVLLLFISEISPSDTSRYKAGKTWLGLLPLFLYFVEQNEDGGRNTSVLCSGI